MILPHELLLPHILLTTAWVVWCIRQIRDHLAERTSEFSGFTTAGILNHIRHPYYTAGVILLLFWGDITATNLILKIVGITYFIVGAFLEERKLLREFGDAYRAYQRRVPMFFPRIKRRSPHHG